MNPTPSSAPDNDVLIVNRSPLTPLVSRARLQHDARAARSARLLCETVLGCSSDGLIYIGACGTYIRLHVPPLLRQMGVGGTAALTSLVDKLNTWLSDRAKIVQCARDPESGLTESDSVIDSWGHPHLRRLILKLAGSQQTTLTLEDLLGAGGDLIIPPSPLLSLPAASGTSAGGDGPEIVTHVSAQTELLTTSGATYLLPSGEVAGEIRCGSTARLHDLRSITRRWTRVTDIRPLHSPKRKTP